MVGLNKNNGQNSSSGGCCGMIPLLQVKFFDYHLTSIIKTIIKFIEL